MATYKTKTGKELTDADIEALAQEVETSDYDVDVIKRGRGRPAMGNGPAELIAVRLEPELHELLEHRAQVEHSSDSDVIRKALRKYLAS